MKSLIENHKSWDVNIFQERMRTRAHRRTDLRTAWRDRCVSAVAWSVHEYTNPPHTAFHFFPISLPLFSISLHYFFTLRAPRKSLACDRRDVQSEIRTSAVAFSFSLRARVASWVMTVLLTFPDGAAHTLQSFAQVQKDTSVNTTHDFLFTVIGEPSVRFTDTELECVCA